MKKPKAGPKPETGCLYYKANGHRKRKCPEYLVDKKDGKVNKGIFDIQVIDVYLTSVYSSPWVFDTCSIANISNSKQELQNKHRLAKGELTIYVGSVSKVDMIKHRTLPLPSRFGVCVEHRHDWIMSIAIRLFI